MATVRFKPAKRVLANVGYSISNVDGSVLQFNILQPLGTVQYKYQQPVANLSVDIGHKLAFNHGLELLPVRGRFVCRPDSATLFSRQLANRVPALLILMWSFSKVCRYEQRIASEYASSHSGRWLRRYPSEIRTGCAHGRSAGAVRGVPGDR